MKPKSSQSGKKNTFCSLVIGRLFVATGYTVDFSYVVGTESFDVLALTTCQSLPDYPLSVAEATGAFVNNKVVICGGDGGGTKCYTLGKDENTWTLIGNMNTARVGAVSVEINNKLVIFGGQRFASSTEEFDVVAGTSTTGSDMPLAIIWSCAVKLDSSTVMIIGGNSGGFLKSTYFYNHNEKTFKAGPDFIVQRRNHACAILQTKIGSYVVVTGGWNGDYLDSTEFLDLNEPTVWKAGLKILSKPKMMQDHKSMLHFRSGASGDKWQIEDGTTHESGHRKRRMGSDWCRCILYGYVHASLCHPRLHMGGHDD